MSALTVAACALCGVFILALLKNHSPAYAAAAETALVSAVLLGVFGEFRELIADCVSLAGEAGLTTGTVSILLKVFGILCAGSFCADICRDSSETALASAVETGSAVLALSAALPVFESVIRLALSLLT